MGIFPDNYVKKLNCPFKGARFNRFVHIVGYCNGVICLLIMHSTVTICMFYKTLVLGELCIFLGLM